MRSQRTGRTLLEQAIARGGLRKGTRVATAVVQWTIAQQDLGHEPTAEEVAGWWKESRATWYRRQADFRELFPDQTNPSGIAAHLIAHMERHGRRATKQETGTLMALTGSIFAGAGVGVT